MVQNLLAVSPSLEISKTHALSSHLFSSYSLTQPSLLSFPSFPSFPSSPSSPSLPSLPSSPSFLSFHQSHSSPSVLYVYIFTHVTYSKSKPQEPFFLYEKPLSCLPHSLTASQSVFHMFVFLLYFVYTF